MRENRLYGSEGGAAELNRPTLPLSVGRSLRDEMDCGYGTSSVG